MSGYDHPPLVSLHFDRYRIGGIRFIVHRDSAASQGRSDRVEELVSMEAGASCSKRQY